MLVPPAPGHDRGEGGGRARAPEEAALGGRRRAHQRGGAGVPGEVASLQGLRLGSRYVRTMEEIESYKLEQRTRTKVHAFVYRNMKTIVAAFSAIGAVAGIVGTLKSLKVVH